MDILPDGRARCELRIDGMRCGACLWLLESIPRLEAGVAASRVHMGRSTLTLEWSDGQTSLSRIAGRISALGYGLRPMGSKASREAWRVEDRGWLVRMGVAGALSSNVMAIAFALYGGEHAWMDGSMRSFLQWTSVALAALAVCWPGSLYLRNAWAAIRTRTPHVDLPIALALAAGLAGGTWTSWRGGSGIYLESVSMLVFLLLVGRFLQFRQQRHARHEVELLCALVPQVARKVVVLEGVERIEEVPTDALSADEIVEVPGGQSAPADGVLESGAAHVDRQWLTGESRPVRVMRGEAVLAGCRAVGAPFRMRVTASGGSTRASRIAAMVDRAMADRPPVVEFANRIAGWFLLAVMALASATGAWWWATDPDRALQVVIAMLVVTCPCALGLATPLTMVASIGKAARAGMLVRSGEVFERLSRKGTLVLDKTGTVTEGALKVVRVMAVRVRTGACAACPSCASGDAACRTEEAIAVRALSAAAALERASSHPLARAIVEHARAHAVPAAAGVAEAHERMGEGMTGLVDGVPVAVGSARLMKALGAKGIDAAAHAVESEAMRGSTPVMVAVRGAVTAVIGISDSLRPDARSTVSQMAARGWHVAMASGDSKTLVRGVAKEIGIAEGDAHGECSPEDKLSLVRCAVRRPVVVVGDGVNDLPAMAAADVGIAMRQGSQAALDGADVALAGDGLMPVVTLLDGAHRTMRAIRVNFAISLAYNLVGAALAATGTITPLIAAVMMPLSGLTVTAVALRMPRFSEVRR